MATDLTDATVDELIAELRGRFTAQNRGLLIMREPLDGSDDARTDDPPEVTFHSVGSTTLSVGMAVRWLARKLSRDMAEDI